MNFGLQLLELVVLCAGSWKIGAWFPTYLHLPMMMGYMLVGVVCGKYVTDMISPSTIDKNDHYSVGSIVEITTLAFIALSAGCELHIPSLGRKRLRQVLLQIAMMGVLMCGVAMPIFFALGLPGANIMPETLVSRPMYCKWSVAWLLAIIQLAGSVIEVLAIFHETKASGPVTQLMLGTTMLLDMIVVTLFATAQTVVVATCPLDGVVITAGSAVVSILAQFTLSVIAGAILAGFLWVYLKLVPRRWPKAFLILVTGWACYFGINSLNKSIPEWAPPSFKLVRIDSLMVCMLSTSLIQHLSSCRDELREVVYNVAPLIMPPFFTIVGAKLELGAISSYAAAVPVFFVTRFVLLATGSFLASVLARETHLVRSRLWMTLQSQSGVTLALILQMTDGLVGLQPWARSVAAIITGCVVLNQLVGPALCRWGIRSAGEAHDQKNDKLKTVATKDVGTSAMTPRINQSFSQELDQIHESDFMSTRRSMSFVCPNLEDHMGESGNTASQANELP